MPMMPHTTPRPWMPKQQPHSGRSVDNSDFYNSMHWRKLRASFLQSNPLCVECSKNRAVVEATVADHIKPIAQGGSSLDESNLQSLCNYHHNKKSGKERHCK